MSIIRIQPGSRMSQAVMYGGLVYTSGQVDKTATDVAGQTQAVLQKIDALLREAGTNKASVISAAIWLSDIETFSAMNDVWDRWVSPDSVPARATVESRLAAPEYKVEIAVIAVVPEKES